MRKITLITILLLTMISSISCAESVATTSNALDNQDVSQMADSGTKLLGYYTVIINEEKATASIEPSRNADLHLNAKQFLLGWPCSNCLQIKNFQFLPGNQVELDIEVRHPVAIPYFTAFDLRVIAIFPADQYIDGIGVSYALLNRDGMTSLWDNLSIPGSIHGYKAYNKSAQRRPFLPGAVLSEHFKVQLPNGPLQFDIGVDASWAENDGIHFPDTANSLEVINLDGYIDEGLTTSGGLAELVVSMYDYQLTYFIGNITAFNNQLFFAPKPLNFVYSDGHNIVYNDLISNERHAPVGTYNVLVQVTDNENAHYPYDLSSYIVLETEVFPSNIEITMLEMDNYKTPGNYFKFYSYEGPADHNVIDYFDHNGPWDFTAIQYSALAERRILIPSDPEISHFSGDFPAADRFVKDDGNFGMSSGVYYQPEKFNYVQMREVPLGFYETEHFGGSIIYDIGSWSGFPFPYNSNTAFSHEFTSGSFISVNYNVQGLGMGSCKIPIYGGTVKSALLMRTVVEISLIVPMLKALIYEWYDDDGNLLALVVSVNLTGQNPQWNESTYEISWGGILSMYQMLRQ